MKILEPDIEPEISMAMDKSINLSIFFPSYFDFNKVPNHISFSFDIGFITEAKLISMFTAFFSSLELSLKNVELKIPS